VSRIDTQLRKEDEQASSLGTKLQAVFRAGRPSTAQDREAYAKARFNSLMTDLDNNPFGIAQLEQGEELDTVGATGGLSSTTSSNIQDLTTALYDAFGLTPQVFNGTATEDMVRAYYQSTLLPIITNLEQELNRKWLTQTARTQGQKVMVQYNLWHLVTVSDLSSIGQELVNTAIFSPDEIRELAGYSPRGGTSDWLYNRNNSMSNVAVTDSDGNITSVGNLAKADATASVPPDAVQPNN